MAMQEGSFPSTMLSRLVEKHLCVCADGFIFSGLLYQGFVSLCCRTCKKFNSRSMKNSKKS